MKDLNMVFLMGNLTRDPELRYTPNGQAVANFAVATNRQWTDPSGEKKDAVEFTEVVVWGKMGENVTNYLKKGRRVHIIGRLQTRSWEAQDGSKRNKTEVIATEVTFLDKAGAGGYAEGAEAKSEKPPVKKSQETNDEVDIEEIPF
jgi:single-strand DNA-binding protein